MESDRGPAGREALQRSAARDLARPPAIPTINLLPSLAASLGEVVDGKSVEIVADESRWLACLRMETDIGVLDGDLGPQLDRLVAALKAR